MRRKWFEKGECSPDERLPGNSQQTAVDANEPQEKKGAVKDEPIDHDNPAQPPAELPKPHDPPKPAAITEPVEPAVAKQSPIPKAVGPITIKQELVEVPPQPIVPSKVQPDIISLIDSDDEDPAPRGIK